MPLIKSAGSGRPGDVKMVAANAVQYGWLKANGATVSRNAYAALFAAIGTVYGVGDGATTFNLPDLRGEFLRGFDDARGVDSARVFGSAQAHELASHTHTLTGAVTNVSGAGGEGSGSQITPMAGTLTTAATGGAETRPRNVAMLAVIKF